MRNANQLFLYSNNLNEYLPASPHIKICYAATKDKRFLFLVKSVGRLAEWNGLFLQNGIAPPE